MLRTIKLFDGSFQQRLENASLEETLDLLFECQQSLIPHTSTLFSSNKNTGFTAMGLFAFGILIASILKLDLIENGKYRNEELIAIDTNRNGIDNEPIDFMLSRGINGSLRILTTLIMVIALMLIMEKFIPTNIKIFPEKWSLVEKKLKSFIETLQADIDDLPDDLRNKLSLGEFKDSISFGFILNPIEVGIITSTSLGEENEEAKIYDYQSFKNYAITRYKNNSQLIEPSTTLPVKSIKFSSELNKGFKNYLLDLSEQVEAFKVEASLRDDKAII